MIMEECLCAGERIDDLQRDGLRIIQRTDGFRFGTDAVLLADFAGVKKGEHVADMAARSVRLNGLETRIRIHHADCREAAGIIGHERCHLVVSNPPYTKDGAGLVSPEQTRALSRSDSDCPIEEWIAACGRLLKNGGRLCCVFPAPRFLELCDAMRGARIEPKRVRFVVARENAAPKLVLVEGLKGGRPALHVQPMLITHDAQGNITQEMRRIYGETD